MGWRLEDTREAPIAVGPVSAVLFLLFLVSYSDLLAGLDG